MNKREKRDDRDRMKAEDAMLRYAKIDLGEAVQRAAIFSVAVAQAILHDPLGDRASILRAGNSELLHSLALAAVEISYDALVRSAGEICGKAKAKKMTRKRAKR